MNIFRITCDGIIEGPAGAVPPTSARPAFASPLSALMALPNVLMGNLAPSTKELGGL